LLLAATVRSLAHMPLGISDRKTIKRDYGLLETIWLNAVVRMRSKIYSKCRCDDTDNVALRDIETSNRYRIQ